MPFDSFQDIQELRTEAVQRETAYTLQRKANDKAQNRLVLDMMKLRSELNEAIEARDVAELSKARLEYIINQLEGYDERFIAEEKVPKVAVVERHKIELLQQHASNMPGTHICTS